jgi:protein-disulfide isomerase
MVKSEGSSKQSLIEKIVPILLVLSIGLAFMVGVLWNKVSSLEEEGVTTKNTTAQAQPTLPAVKIDTIKGLFSKDVLKFGDTNRKVLFVEIADPSCPYCAAADGKNRTIYKSLGEKFKLNIDGGQYIAPAVEMKKLVDAGKASYVYIYYPGHSNGELGMKALYCSQEKGKFWEARDLIMNDEGYTLMNTTVKNDKAQSGVVADFLKGAVDADFMKSCLESGKYDSRLVSDQTLAIELGVQGTPGFFINEKMFPGAYSWNDMKSVVETALK